MRPHPINLESSGGWSILKGLTEGHLLSGANLDTVTLVVLTSLVGSSWDELTGRSEVSSVRANKPEHMWKWSGSN